MKSNKDHAAEVLEALRQAVTEALERKSRLGQYAVIWQDGRTVRVGRGALADLLERGAETDATLRGLDAA